MSDPAAELAYHIQVSGLPQPKQEYKFLPGRRFRFDFAWPDLMIAAEVEGGTWAGGRHVRGDGYERDCQKYNLATFAGWRVYRFTTGMVNSGEAIATLQEALAQKPEHFQEISF